MTNETSDPLAALTEAQAKFDSVIAPNGVPGQPWTPELVQYLSISLMAFTILTLILASVLLWRSNASPQHVLQVFGILAIIGISALLLITGFSNDQLTPIIGLFGAIAGYLLGKDSSNQGDTT